MNFKEENRRKQISNSLKLYYLTEKGIQHKITLSKLQRKRMKEYNEYLKNNMINLNIDEKNIKY